MHALLEIRCYSAPFWGAHINVYILLPYRVLATPLYIERVLNNTPGVVNYRLASYTHGAGTTLIQGVK